MPRRLAILWLLALVVPATATAQVPLFLAGQAGGAFVTDENTPNGTGSGFAWQGQAGVSLSRVGFGGEFGNYKTGGGARSRVYGGFARALSPIGNGATQLYLVVGLGAYQFTPTVGKGRTTIGGSLGPGVRFGFRGSPLAILAEVRFHSTFESTPRINNQQFIAATGGLEFRF